jgi:tripartite-type tricarboxylate transporter receptor subunit TctC
MSLSRRRLLHLAAGAVPLALASRRARGDTYPARPIRLIVPFPPGGVADAVARPWADKTKALLGTVVVENVGGGGSSLGSAAAAHAAPDGYTLLLGGSVTYVNELLKTGRSYDPARDLEPICNIVSSANVVAVHPSVPVHTLSELVDYAKANPGKLTYGTPGVGTLPHLTVELFKAQAGAPAITHVPYRGAGPALTDAVAGQISVCCAVLTGQVLAFHRSDKLRILAIASSARLAAAPELATVAEMGYPALAAPSLWGVLGPAHTPKPVVEKIAETTHTALADRAYQQFLVDGCFEPDIDSTPERFGRQLADDVARWSPLVETLGLKIG